MPGSPKKPREPVSNACTDELAPLDLLDWAVQALAPVEQTPARHHRLLLSELEAVSSGRVDRLMVLMPPGSAKSTYASVLFPAWWFAQHPRSSVIAASHTAELAHHFGRAVRGLIAEHQGVLCYALATDDRAASRWRTTKGGEYFATGVRGPITGRRADLAILDDPIKSQFEVDSARSREFLWSWYRSDLTTRLKPRGRIVIVMTRWHEDDLAGRLLAHWSSEWRLLRLPALAEADDPLLRKLGEPLWPDWEDAIALERKRTAVGERVWSALFQQSPRPPHGSLFKVNRIGVLDGPLSGALGRTVRAWDFASTSETEGGDPDWTVGLKLACYDSDYWVVLDVARFRGTPMAVCESLVSIARADGSAVAISLPEDPGQAGKYQARDYIRRLAGYRVWASRESGSKILRATPVAAQVEAGNILMARGAWNHAFIEELREFPHGRKDDQVDALSRAFVALTEDAAPARRMTVSLIGR